MHIFSAFARSVLEDLAIANRILFDQGVLDAFGHVSARHPDAEHQFLLARNMAPGLVTPDDIMTFNLDSEPCVQDGRPIYLERFIHGEIYRVRPDVMAIVHSHSPAIIPFGVVPEIALRPVFHMSGFLGSGSALFEIRCCAGAESDLLIRNSHLGAELARSLGNRSLVVMRGHGSTVVGSSLRQVVFRAVYAEVNARLQTTAMQLGSVNYLTSHEAAAAAASNDGQTGRAWEMWKLLAERRAICA